jgi:lipid-A-disaccharide synthase
VRALLPVFTQTLALLAARFPDLVVVVPTVETVADPVAAVAATWPVRTIILRGSVEKYDAFAASTVALAASGTVTLELAMAGLPMVVTYRIWPVTAWLIRRAVKVRWANLVNILCDREVAPEFLQERCRPELLAAAVVTLFEDERARAAQRTGFDEVLVQLGRGGSRPSLRAADKILALLGLNPVDPPLKVSPHS